MTRLISIVAFLLWAAGANSGPAKCEFDIVVGDYLKFSSDEMLIKKSCGNVSINLVHEGKLPANLMGHNWVLTKTAHVEAAATSGIMAGLDNDYVEKDDNRILAWTKIIGGGEKTSMSFSTSDLTVAGDYTFFCSFPGHSYGMKGKLIVTK